MAVKFGRYKIFTGQLNLQMKNFNDGQIIR